jgi:hypothetical protein
LESLEISFRNQFLKISYKLQQKQKANDKKKINNVIYGSLALYRSDNIHSIYNKCDFIFVFLKSIFIYYKINR